MTERRCNCAMGDARDSEHAIGCPRFERWAREGRGVALEGDRADAEGDGVVCLTCGRTGCDCGAPF